MKKFEFIPDEDGEYEAGGHRFNKHLICERNGCKMSFSKHQKSPTVCVAAGICKHYHCDQKTRALGYCKKHYQRIHRAHMKRKAEREAERGK